MGFLDNFLEIRNKVPDSSCGCRRLFRKLQNSDTSNSHKIKSVPLPNRLLSNGFFYEQNGKVKSAGHSGLYFKDRLCQDQCLKS